MLFENADIPVLFTQFFVGLNTYGAILTVFFVLSNCSKRKKKQPPPPPPPAANKRVKKPARVRPRPKSKTSVSENNVNDLRSKRSAKRPPKVPDVKISGKSDESQLKTENVHDSGFVVAARQPPINEEALYTGFRQHGNFVTFESTKNLQLNDIYLELKQIRAALADQQQQRNANDFYTTTEICSRTNITSGGSEEGVEEELVESSCSSDCCRRRCCNFESFDYVTGNGHINAL